MLSKGNYRGESEAKYACRGKILAINLADSKKHCTFAPAFERLQHKVDPLAQSVEHNTFNVGVLGSSPKRITKNNPQEVEHQRLADFLFLKAVSRVPFPYWSDSMIALDDSVLLGKASQYNLLPE